MAIKKSNKSNSPSTVTITSGFLKGQTIPVPKSAHPMGSRERLALFNSISDFIPGSMVLDLYAGSGALGIEAVSRGADCAYFIEKNYSAAMGIFKVLRDQLSATVMDGCRVLNMPTQVFLNEYMGKFNVIIADPPYNNYHPEELDQVADFLSDYGILALSHPTATAPDLPHLKCISTKKYANCHISLFTKS